MSCESRTRPVVMIAEDDVEQRVLYAEILRSFGVDVIEVGDGAAAVATVQDRRPDLVLLDMNLPELDGVAVARALKRDPATAHIPIVAITGVLTPEMRRSALTAGCATYLTKPYSPMALLAEVKHWLKPGSLAT